ETGVEGGEILPQGCSALRVEAVSKHAGWPVTFRESVPGGLAAGLAVIRDSFLEAELEVAAKQLLYALGAAPFKRGLRRGVRRRRHVSLHHCEHFVNIAV